MISLCQLIYGLFAMPGQSTCLFNQNVSKEQNSNGNYPPWYYSEIINKIKVKTKLLLNTGKNCQSTYNDKLRAIRCNLQFKIRNV